MLGLLILAAGMGPAFADTDPRPRRAGIKIEVSAPGLYRLTGADIRATGVDPALIAPDTIRVFRKDAEIACDVSAAPSGMADTDFLEFYAQGMDNQYTNADVYWLYWGGDAGRRMAWTDGAVSGAASRISSFSEILTVEENHALWTETPAAPAADYWFWERFTSPQSAEYAVQVPSPVKNAGNAEVTAVFQGRSGTHRTVVSLNGRVVSDETWEGSGVFTPSGLVPQTALGAGANTLKVECRSAGSPDVLYFNRLEIRYRRHLAAAGGVLEFSLADPDAGDVEITGFTGSTIRIFDITDPQSPRRMANVAIAAAGSGFSAAFAHAGGEKTYLAVGSDGVRTPDRIIHRKFSNLRNTGNAADYLVIAPKEFMPALADLLELRRRQGMTVMAADIEEIYDVFSYGVFDPRAIRDFLKYAWENWSSPAPRYVLLAGDANLDYRNYLGAKKRNRVPVYLDKTADLGLTPSDNWFGCVDGEDAVPELYVGRIPGDFAADVTAIVNKLIRHASDRHQDAKTALFVADDDDTAFEELNDALMSYLPGDFAAETVYTRFYNAFDVAAADIRSVVNAGAAMVNFVGHGDVTRWGAEPDGGGEFIFDPDDLDGLTNRDTLPFVLALNCLNGYFSQPLQYSLAEEWVMAEDRGAVACLAPSGLSHQWEHEFISHRIFSRIFLDGETRLGDVVVESKIDAYYSGASDQVLVSFNLIGDPATILAVDRDPADLVAVHEINATSGAGGAISPAGEVVVLEGVDRVFTITPAAGYRVSAVTVDGASQGAISAYTFTNVRADHAISAAFEMEKSSSGGGGGGGGCFIRTVMD